MFFRDGHVRLRGEVDCERAVDGSLGRSVSDLLTGVGARPPPVAVAEPVRVTDFSNDSPLHHCSVDRRSRVGLCRAGERDVSVQPATFFRGSEFHLELRPFVFLNGDLRVALRVAIDTDHHPAHQAIPGSGEAAVEAAVVVRLVFLPSDLFAVRILENHREIGVRQNLIVVLFGVHRDAETLVVNGLAGSVQAAVGEEHRPRVRPRLVLDVGVVIVAGRQGLVLVASLQDQLLAVDSRDREEAVLVGGDLTDVDPAGSFTAPRLDDCLGEWLTAFVVEDKTLNHTLEVSIANDECQFADPEVAELNTILIRSEVLLVAGEKEV